MEKQHKQDSWFGMLTSLKEFFGLQEPPPRAPVRTEGKGRQEADVRSVLEQEAAKKHLREITANRSYGSVRTAE